MTPDYSDHAQGCTKRGENVVAMLCLEMVGYFVDHKNSQQVPPAIPKWLRWLFPSRGNFLAAVANPPSWKLCWQFRRGFKKATRFPLFSIVLPERIPEIHLSDHRAFWLEGFPALMLTDTSFDWQSSYRWPDNARRFKQGTRINGIAHFDNSSFNPFNPDPKATVRHGLQTSDEMMFGFLFFTRDDEALNLTIDPQTGHVTGN